MEFLFKGFFQAVAAAVLAFGLGLFSLTGCHVDGERWNNAMQEAWQSLAPPADDTPTSEIVPIEGDGEPDPE